MQAFSLTVAPAQAGFRSAQGLVPVAVALEVAWELPVQLHPRPLGMWQVIHNSPFKEGFMQEGLMSIFVSIMAGRAV